MAGRSGVCVNAFLFKPVPVVLAAEFSGVLGRAWVCDHAAAVPAVRRVLRASGSVSPQNDGHSSCMQILVPNCAADRGDLTGTVLGGCGRAYCLQRQVPWLGRAVNCGVSAVAVLGVVQFLDKVVVPVGATTGGRAMLGSTMDTCYGSSRVAFGRFFMIFYMIGWTRLLRFILRPGWQIVDDGSGMFHTAQLMLRLLMSCTWESVHYFYEPPVFSACSGLDFLRESIFLEPSSTHTCEC